MKTSEDTLRLIDPPVHSVDFAGIFRRNFKADDVPVKKPQLLAEALTDFKNSDYETIQALHLDDLPVRGDLPDEDINSARNVRELGRYYKGLSYTETKNDKQAMENLQWVADNARNRGLVAKSQWFLALIHIRQKNADNAAALLSKVAANEQAAPYNLKTLLHA